MRSLQRAGRSLCDMWHGDSNACAHARGRGAPAKRARQPGRECAGALSVPLHFAGRRARLAGTARAGTRGGGRDARGSPARGTWRPANGSARGGGRPRSAWRGLPPVSVGSAARDSGSSSRNALQYRFPPVLLRFTALEAGSSPVFDTAQKQTLLPT